MADAKHTPGPWAYVPAKGIDRDFGIKAAPCKNILAECFEEFWAKGDRRPGEAEANARLIAAAPDMLEALQEIEPFLRSREDADHNGNTFVPNEAMRLLIQLRAAISKATGTP